MKSFKSLREQTGASTMSGSSSHSDKDNASGVRKKVGDLAKGAAQMARNKLFSKKKVKK